tara:strand:- start:2024 stop:2785 length:762 start_codon:yes stop_codon:yes gene_type:complete
MKQCIILSHQFILPNNSLNNKYGFAASWGDEWKLKVFDFCIRHFRTNNPEAYLIVTGHGLKPLQSSLELVDWYYWPDRIISGEINYGHPFLVSKGIQHAIDNKIEYVCKTRLDTVNLISDLCKHCHSVLLQSGKRILNTHYNKLTYSMMDLFNYAKSIDLIKLYNHDHWRVPWIPDGTGPVARNYIQLILNKKITFPFDPLRWNEMANLDVVYKTPNDLKWIDLRKNHTVLDSIKKELLDNNFIKCKPYVWRH